VPGLVDIFGLKMLYSFIHTMCVKRGSTMKIVTHLPLLACLALSLAGCKGDDAPKPVLDRPAVSVPAGDDHAEWVAYVSDTVGRNMGTITNQPYVYFLPGENGEDFEGNYERLAEKVMGDIARGVLRGNMLAFSSPASDKIADIVVQSFDGVPPESMKGVRLLFIGKAIDGERVREAVSPAGLDYVFVDTNR